MSRQKLPLPDVVRLTVVLNTTNGTMPVEGIYAAHLAHQIKLTVKPKVSLPRVLGREVFVTVRLGGTDEAAAERVKELLAKRWKSRLREVTVLPPDKQGRAGLLLRWPNAEETNAAFGTSYDAPGSS